MQNETQQKTSPDEYLFSEKLWKKVLTLIFLLSILGGAFTAVELADSYKIYWLPVGGVTGCIIGFISVGFFSIFLTISKNISRIADSIENNN